MPSDRAAILPISRRWIVVNSQPQREHVAVQNLERQGFECYLPLVRKRISHARRKYEALRPLFPAYLFVAQGRQNQHWRPLLSTYGVRSVVRCGDEPSFLTDDFVSELKNREIDGVIARPSSPFRIGQQVRISNSALEGLVATIIEMDEKSRLVVLLNLLDRPVRVKLTSDLIAETTIA